MIKENITTLNLWRMQYHRKTSYIINFTKDHIQNKVTTCILNKNCYKITKNKTKNHDYYYWLRI